MHINGNENGCVHAPSTEGVLASLGRCNAATKTIPAKVADKTFIKQPSTETRRRSGLAVA
jgi:hypothetical protein